MQRSFFVIPSTKSRRYELSISFAYQSKADLHISISDVYTFFIRIDPVG